MWSGEKANGWKTFSRTRVSNAGKGAMNSQYAEQLFVGSSSGNSV